MAPSLEKNRKLNLSTVFLRNRSATITRKQTACPDRTRREARQIVGHRHVLVNGHIVNIPSFLVKAGDEIEIKEKAKGSERYKQILEVTGGRLVPSWLDADQENLKGTVKELPNREAIDVPVNEMLIVELYSK